MTKHTTPSVFGLGRENSSWPGDGENFHKGPAPSMEGDEASVLC